MTHRPSGLEICSNAGIDNSFNNEVRLQNYAAVGEWMVPQFERQTGHSVSAEDYKLLALVNVALAIVDDSTDTNALPDWDQTYQPATMGTSSCCLPIFEAGSPLCTYPTLIEATADQLDQLNSKRADLVRSCWDSLVMAAYEYKLASISGEFSVSEIIVTRVGEAVAMADLYTSLMLGEQDDYWQTKYSEWLAIELAAGNLVNTVFGAKEDQKDGHRALTLSERLKLNAATACMAVKFATDPMTSTEDMKVMARKFFKSYLLGK